MSALGPDLAFWLPWAFLSSALLGPPALRALAHLSRFVALTAARRARHDLDPVRRES
ncbi:MAG: hypothetical protein AAFU73_19355 [Planctomycetota bacterium]